MKQLLSSARDGNLEVHVIDADGSGPRRITFNEQFDADPAWSPDGKRLVFVRGPAPANEGNPPPAPPDLWIVDLKDGEERNLTNSPGRKTSNRRGRLTVSGSSSTRTPTSSASSTSTPSVRADASCAD